MDVEQGTNNALRDFDSKNHSRRNKILAGVGIGCLVLGGVAVGVYFGVNSSSSSSNNDLGPPPNTPVAKAADAYPYWAQQYPVSAKTEGSQPNSLWLAAANQIMASSPNILYPALIAQLGLFAGLTQDQINQWKGHNPAQQNITNTPVIETQSTIGFLTSGTVDWRTNANVITPIKNQMQCGSCWSFAAAQGVEAAYGVISGQAPYNLAAYVTPTSRTGDNGQGNAVGFSSQQIAACDTYDSGCNGGNAQTAIDSYLSKVSLAAAADYPYADGSGNGVACDSSKVTNAATLGASDPRRGIKVGTNAAQQVGKCSYPNLCPYTAAQENAVQTALASGPLLVAVDASGFNNYVSGVVDGTGKNYEKGTNTGQITCDTTGNTQATDHAIQLVGYNTQTTPGYWIVRNQWGTTWGESGYIRMATGGNPCCLLCFPLSVTVPSTYAGSPVTTKSVATTKLPTTYIPSSGTTTASRVATTTASKSTTSAPTQKPTITIITTPPPPPPTSYGPCNENALTSSNENIACYSTSATVKDFYCLSKPDAAGLYYCCYSGAPGSWGGSYSIRYSTLNGVVKSVQCVYQPSAGQPQYPPLPSGSSSGFTISSSCISADGYGNDLAFWYGGLCYDINTGAVDKTGLECSNPAYSPLCPTQNQGYAAINQYGQGC